VCRRPDYKKLGVLKQQFPEVPIMALTATATDLVCQSVKDILRISACEFFRSSVDRPNLYWTVGTVCLAVFQSLSILHTFQWRTAAELETAQHTSISNLRLRIWPVMLAGGQVRQKAATAQETTADIVAWIRSKYRPVDSGVIYCQTRKVSLFLVIL